MRKIHSPQNIAFYVETLPIVKQKSVAKNWQPSENARILFYLFAMTGIAFGFLYFACKLIEAG